MIETRRLGDLTVNRILELEEPLMQPTEFFIPKQYLV